MPYNSAGKRPRSPSAELSLHTKRVKYLKALPSESPSIAASSSGVKQMQQSKTKVYCNRPQGDASSTPVELLHPIFGEFLKDAATVQPSKEAVAFAKDFCVTLCKFHENEHALNAAVRELVMKHFGINLQASEVGGTMAGTDGSLSLGALIFNIWEGKLGNGSTLSDPAIQALQYHKVSLGKLAPEHANSRLPCLHVYYFGESCPFVQLTRRVIVRVQGLTSALRHQL